MAFDYRKAKQEAAARSAAAETTKEQPVPEKAAKDGEDKPEIVAEPASATEAAKPEAKPKAVKPAAAKKSAAPKTSHTGAGRPKLDENRETTPVTIVLFKDQRTALKRWALDNEDEGISSVIRKLIDDFLRKEGYL